MRVSKWPLGLTLLSQITGSSVILGSCVRSSELKGGLKSCEVPMGIMVGVKRCPKSSSSHNVRKSGISLLRSILYRSAA